MTRIHQNSEGLNKQIRRAIRQKHGAYTKSRRTGKKKDKDRYKKLQAKVQFDVRSAHKQYMQDVVSNSYKGNPKKLVRRKQIS